MPAGFTEDTPLHRLVGKAHAPGLERNKGLRTLGDLLTFVPRRYLRPSEPTPFAELRDGESAMVLAKVRSATRIALRQRHGSRLVVVLDDEAGGDLELVFFHGVPGHERVLRPGRRGVFVGTVGTYRGTVQLAHPEYDVFDDEQQADVQATYRQSHWIPVYSVTGRVTSLALRRAVAVALDSLADLPDPLPATLRMRRGLQSRRAALELVHRPALDDPIDVGLRRLRYDEAFVLQTILAQRRRAAAELGCIPRPARPGGLLDAFDARLPFDLTAGQREVGALLATELTREHPMHRLLQGEVGAGKTVVALRAMLQVIDAGGQAVLLAPTEVLAAQHHRSITALLGDLALGGLLGGSDLGTTVGLLTGSQGAKARNRALAEAASGAAGIVVGTHALIQKHVEFRDLGLVVVDEQHRFGVEQRDALREKGQTPPHLLVMTATPIPRTVAMTVFGDMETATLTELPAGRQPITTHVVDVASRPAWVERTWTRVAEEVAVGHQVYVVCPKIGDPDDGAVLTRDSSDEDADWEPPDPDDEGADPDAAPICGVYAVAALLREHPALADARLGILHGRLPAEDKDAVMTAFAAGRIDVLVATTVIEVGVDVANATTMVVMDADRFGMSQLHQLRGRVGRGTEPGLCLLLTAGQGKPARQRLEAVAATADGFELARRDLQLRREGDVLGARQSGVGSSVRFLRMGHRDDEELITMAREDAHELVTEDPTLRRHRQLADLVRRRLDEEQAAYLERG